MNFRSLVSPVAVMLFCFTLPASSYAQNVKVLNIGDAIHRLDRTHDTARIDLLLQISEELIKSQPRDAFGYAREAVTLSEKLHDHYRTGLSDLSLARIYCVSAVYDKALDYGLIALKQFERLDDTVRMALCYNEIGTVHMLSGDFRQAQDNYLMALDLNKKTGNHSEISNIYMNIGLNYLHCDSVDKGLSYFLVSLMIADSLNMDKEKVVLMKNIGYAYARLGRYEDALGHFYQVLDLLGRQPDDLTRSDAQVNIAKGYYQLKNYPAALKYAQEGYTLARKKRFDHIYRDASKLLSDIYAAQGEYKQAYEYMKVYRDISDTVLNAEKAEQLARIQTIYEVNLKEEENLSLRNQIIHNLKKMRARTLVIIVVTLLVLVLAIVLLMLNRLNNKQLALNSKLARQSKELEALNDLKDKFFSFVAHNLRNPFNTIMGFSELMQRAAESKDIKKAREYSGLIYDLSAQVQKVLANLLEWSRLQRRTFEVKPDSVELTGLIKDVVEMNNKEAARKDISLTISSESTVFVVADRTMIATVLQNLVTNAIHYTPPSGRISIVCRVKDQYTEVGITDTGIGIPQEKMAALFDFNLSQERGIKSDHGAGLGLVICHEMLVKNGGNISVESSPGKGSTFSFTLPVAIRHDAGHETEKKHVEKTAVDVTENLLSSGLPVNAGLSLELKTQVVPLYEEVSRVLSIKDLEQLSRIIIATGEKHHYLPLVDYGKSLQSLTIGHQIDQIIKMVPPFGEFLKKEHIV
jgi:signal transduction histidine kinase